MPSRAGSPNKDKTALRELAAQHGVDPIEMRMILVKDLWKACQNELERPRSRRSKQYFQAEIQLDKFLAELTPYLHGKLSNVTVADETPRITVIRAPEPISDSQKWLEECRPQNFNRAINERPRN
jgi:hypothetical protein